MELMQCSALLSTLQAGITSKQCDLSEIFSIRYAILVQEATGGRCNVLDDELLCHVVSYPVCDIPHSMNVQPEVILLLHLGP